FGFDEVASLIPQRQSIRLAPTIHTGQKSAIINIDDIKNILPSVSVARGSRLFFIIEGAESMNETASNALLKSLEEPAENVVFIFLTENCGSLLPTIRSRSQHLRLKTPNLSETWTILDPKNRVADDKRRQIDFLARGSIGLMRTLIGSKSALNEKAKRVEFAKSLLSNDRYERARTIWKIKKSTRAREVATETCELCLEICLNQLKSQSDFDSMHGIIKKCTAFESALTDLSRSNNFNPILLLASQCVYH
ncbi:hypothetical protein FWH09_03265, partial [Candidatus Saccharibacteria bacterium]|nr:hypothetical protein [Candidatus Saccharibacteria bacterium]